MSYSHPNARYPYRNESPYGQSRNGPVDYSGGESSSFRYGYGRDDYRNDYGGIYSGDDRYRSERNLPYGDRYTNHGYGDGFGYERRNDYNYNASRPYENPYPPQDQYRPTNNDRASTYIPPYQRGFSSPIQPSFPPYDRPPSPQSIRHYSTHAHSQSRTPFSRDRTVTPPPVNLPPREYLDLLRPNPAEPLKSERIIPKLLVLDLNGALVFRNRSSSADGRNSHPRPYLQSFLEYLFLPDLNSKRGGRGWEVFVWSSAQPHNVRGMVESAFGPRFIEGIWEEEAANTKSAREQEGEGRLLDVWARDKMGLTDNDYSRKVQTTKDLRKVLDHLRHLSSDTNQPLWDFDEKRIVLLDDSPLKAIYQPFNQLVIPEFGKDEYQNSKLAAFSPGLQEGSLDQTLLAVIGILDELRYVNNVPFWIKSGGLLDPNGLPLSVSVDSKEDKKIQLEHLPTHDSFTHWFSNKEIFDGWVEQGKIALKEKGIDIKHGISPDHNFISQSQKTKETRTHPPVKLRNKHNRGYHTNNGIDDDEFSPPPPSPSQMNPLDVARYIDSLICSTSNLTVEQKDSLVVAREIISELHSQHPQAHAAGQDTSNGNNIVNREGISGNEKSPYRSSAPVLSPPLNPGTQNIARDFVDGANLLSEGFRTSKGSESRRQRQNEYRSEFSKAKILNPKLTNKEFRKKFKAIKKDSSALQGDLAEVGESGSENDKEEIEADQARNEDEDEDVRVISKMEFINNYQKNLSSSSQHQNPDQIEINDALSELSYGAGSRSRDGSKKKLRSDSWSGE
ncbi:hypothetical protein I203_100934 [Kwoniella mangroviensis CBS 8507]|uniref:uncharacterized protein n=1 Tax=Kwoniella mangroviensis CBS 8507 TaxID=1296122 RepID=UPI00080D0D55|nr:uncharacterized protein I203_02573 [Kwoniella mangroviensis CBS 8507]OCF67915.1 hypothetical protein I203_02573 [Kwoniella mangroviensis CBS 8507]